MSTLHREGCGDNHSLERAHCSREFWPIHSSENRTLRSAYYGTWFSLWLCEAWKEVSWETNFPQLKIQIPTYLFWSQDYRYTEHRLRHLDSGNVSDNWSLVLWFRMLGQWPQAMAFDQARMHVCTLGLVWVTLTHTTSICYIYRYHLHV